MMTKYENRKGFVQLERILYAYITNYTTEGKKRKKWLIGVYLQGNASDTERDFLELIVVNNTQYSVRSTRAMFEVKFNDLKFKKIVYNAF